VRPMDTLVVTVDSLQLPRRGVLDEYLHLFALNRGILMTPFHNMALMAPATTAADVDRHTEMFREAVAALVAG